MVLKDVCELRNCQVGQCGADCLEGGVVGCKDSNVAEAINYVSQLSLFEGTSNTAQACVDGGGRDIFGHSEDSIDNVNDTSSEVLVLHSTSQRGFGLGTISHLQPL